MSSPDLPVATHRLKILVVGGGLCGLATAISCSLAGHDVTVFESAPQLQQVGAGINISPNGNRLLQRWGLWEALAPVAVQPSSFFIRRFDGRVLGQRLDYDTEMAARYGVPSWNLHRADLHRALAQRATELGAKIRLGSHVKDVDFHGPLLRLANGRTEAGDLVVAADGLWSGTRSAFLGREAPPLATGDLAFRVTLKVDEIEDQELLALVKPPGFNMWLGPKGHVVSYCVRSATLLNMVFIAPDDLPEGIARQPGNIEQLRQLLKGWDPILCSLIAGVDEVVKWKLMHHPPLDRLATISGQFIMARLVSSMLPYSAQGANSSFEDAAVLGSLLSKITSPGDLPAVAATYSKLRHERVVKIHADAFVRGSEFHLADGPQQIERDEMLAYSYTRDDWTRSKIDPWLYSFDAYRAAEAEYGKMLSETTASV